MTDVPARLPFAAEEGATADLLRARRGGSSPHSTGCSCTARRSPRAGTLGWTRHVTMDDGPRTVAATIGRGGRAAMRTEPPSPHPEVLPA